MEVAVGDYGFSYLLVRNDLTNTPSLNPTKEPSAVPSESPSLTPSEVPSQIPSLDPTKVSSAVPSEVPSLTPSEVLSQIPSLDPTKESSAVPSEVPSQVPSFDPTKEPSAVPSEVPSQVPSLDPTKDSSTLPSEVPSLTPSEVPSQVPSLDPTKESSAVPSEVPSQIPSLYPTKEPSAVPSEVPSQVPSLDPTKEPSAVPSEVPSQISSLDPTKEPSAVPSEVPSKIPSLVPSSTPTVTPSFAPTAAISKADFALTFLRNDTIIGFAGNSTDKEIIIKSLISNKVRRDSFQQTIWVGPDCKFEVDVEYPDDTTLVTITNNDALDVIEGKNKQVTSEIDIDTLNVASKGVHSNSTKSIYSEYVDGSGKEKAIVEFCVRTDYGKVNITTSNGNMVESSINFYKVKIAINFELEFGFISSNVTIEEEDAGEAQKAAVITTNLEACDCPADANSNTDCYETGTSNAKTYNQNDILSVCIYDPNENSIITSFKDIKLGNRQISTQVIDPDG